MEEDSLVERGDLAPPGLFLALYPVSLLRKCNSYFSMNLVYLYMPRTVPTSESSKSTSLYRYT